MKNYYDFINEEYDYQNNQFEVGDWVKLGIWGLGWGNSEVGEIAKIKEIGNFNLGYDIVLDSDSNPKLVGQQCARSNGFRGCSSMNMTLTTEEEILSHLDKYNLPRSLYDNQPDDDRFEKWEERKVNEEYNDKTHKFEIGDRVKLVRIKSNWEINIDEALGSVGVIDDIYSSILYSVKFDKNIIVRRDDHTLYDYYYRDHELELIEEPLDDRFEKWEEKINENTNYLELKKKFDVGDRVIISGVQDGVEFNEDPGKIIYMNWGRITVQFDRSIEEISSGKKRGHDGNGHGEGVHGFCWVIQDKNLTVEPEIPDDDRFEKWEEKVNEASFTHRFKTKNNFEYKVSISVFGGVFGEKDDILRIDFTPTNDSFTKNTNRYEFFDIANNIIKYIEKNIDLNKINTIHLRTAGEKRFKVFSKYIQKYLDNNNYNHIKIEK